MKKRIGTLKGKPIVIGDPNLLTENEILYSQDCIVEFGVDVDEFTDHADVYQLLFNGTGFPLCSLDLFKEYILDAFGQFDISDSNIKFLYEHTVGKVQYLQELCRKGIYPKIKFTTPIIASSLLYMPKTTILGVVNSYTTINNDSIRLITTSIPYTIASSEYMDDTSTLNFIFDKDDGGNTFCTIAPSML